MGLALESEVTVNGSGNVVTWVLLTLAVVLVGAGLYQLSTGSPGGERPGLRLEVNIPAYRLDVYRGGERIRSYPVAVGMPSHRTPRGTYRISRAVWNPWWHPPDRSWARGAQPAPPGPRNPMGRVKLYFRDLYFIHGTPNAGSIGRAASHGCIRMRNADAIELARLVHREGAPGVSDGDIDRILANSSRTRTIGMARSVPLRIVYEPVEVHDGDLEIHPDIYGFGRGAVTERALQEIEAAGYDVAALDRTALEDLVLESRERPVSVPVESLLTGEPVGEPVETSRASADRARVAADAGTRLEADSADAETATAPTAVAGAMGETSRTGQAWRRS